uniref:C2 domain-containing protein n=1 Tax=Chrysotila carterae TaxID=13221 RepID=A0A7S4F4Z3_CHRCT
MNKWEKQEELEEKIRHDHLEYKGLKLGTGQALRICAYAARNLPETDWWPKDTRPDAYIITKLYGTAETEVSCKSEQLRNSASPRFSFCCNLNVPEPVEIQIELWDHDYVTSDQLLGVCMRMEPTLREPSWCSLRDRNADAQAGEVLFAVTLVDGVQGAGNLPASPPFPPLLPLPPRPPPMPPMPPNPPALPPGAPWSAAPVKIWVPYAIAAGIMVVAMLVCFLLPRIFCRKGIKGMISPGSSSRFRSIELTHLAIVQQHALGSQAADDAKLVNEAGLVGHPGQMPITSTLSMQNARMELNSRA